MKVVLILQARLGSKRLPGKNLLEIRKNQKETLVELVLKRIQMAKNIDKVVVAIPNNKQNDKLNNLLKKKGFLVFRGDENNALKRYYEAARKHKADIIVRITSDCALIDPFLIDKCIKIFKYKKPDYLSNRFNLDNVNHEYSWMYPDGFDTEVFSFKLLKHVHSKHKLADRVEGTVITTYFKQNPNERKKFNLIGLNSPKLLKQKPKLSIDGKKDLILIKKIYEHFSPKINFTWDDVVSFLKLEKITKKEKGQVLWKKAKKVILSGNMILSKNPEMFLPNKWPTYYKKSKGCNIWDLDNRKFIDMSTMGVGTNILGYCNSEVDKAVKKVIEQGNLTTLNCPEEVELAEKLISLHSWADKVKFARTGGEANAIAMRIARSNTTKHNVAFCGYHGWHDWYLSSNLLDKKNLDTHLIPGLEPIGVHKNLAKTSFAFNYNDFNNLKKLVSEKNIGIIKMEVCRSTKPNVSFLKKVRELSTKKGIILIFDECSSGFRENLGGLHQKIKIEPDMALFGKALGNGYAISAIVGKKDVMNSAEKSFISSTFWSERIGPTAGIKVLEIMEREKSWKKITSLGESLMSIWKKLSKRHKLKINIFGIPSLAKFSLVSPDSIKYKSYITQEMLKRNFLASSSVYMSTSHNIKILKKYEEILDQIFFKIAECENGNELIENLLKFPASRTPFGRVN